jgi:EryCIII-like glycosyltransferase
VKVLVVSAPLVGHVTPLLPLAAAARAAGHDVLIATSGDALRVDTGGLPVRDVGATPFAWAVLRAALAHPRLIAREATGRAGVRMAGALFGRINAAMVDGLVALAREWRPDLVVHESLGGAATVAAAAVGAPAVLQENSLWDGPELVAATWRNPALRRAAGRAGVAGPASAGTITIAPRSVVGDRAGRPMRAVRPPAGAELPGWLTAPRDRPLVLVSHTTAGNPPGSDPMAAVLAAAGQVEADFVLVRGPRKKATPANVRVTGWLPLVDALPLADAFVHHGGAGGLLEALAAGVPQLAVPGPGDRRYNAEALARRGAGLAVPVKEITPAALTRLTTDDSLRRAAREVAAEIAALPEPAELVGYLESVARERP